MADKNGFAQVLDKIVEGIANSKNKEQSSSQDLNMLPKPGVQQIGDGVIVWRWFCGGVVIEAVLATRHGNQMNLEEGKYLISVKMPESSNGMYTLYEEVAKELGQALMSAWNWQHVWKLHAGDFLLEEMSKQPAEEFIDEDIETIAEVVSEDEQELEYNI